MKKQQCENCKKRKAIFYKSSKIVCYKCYVKIDDEENRKEKQQKTMNKLYYEKRRKESLL